MEYFEKFGEIESVNLKLDPVTGRYLHQLLGDWQDDNYLSNWLVDWLAIICYRFPFLLKILMTNVYQSNRSRCFAFLVFKEKESVEKVFFTCYHFDLNLLKKKLYWSNLSKLRIVSPNLHINNNTFLQIYYKLCARC